MITADTCVSFVIVNLVEMCFEVIKQKEVIRFAAA